MTDKPKKYKLEPEPGGEFPDINSLFNETLAEFQDNMNVYVLAGVGQLIVIMPVVLIGVFALYAGMAVGMGGVMFLGVAVGGLLMEYVSEGLGVVVMMLTQFLAILVPIAVLLLFVQGIAAIIAPFNASLIRAVARHQRGEKELDLAGVFSSIGQDVPKVIAIGMMLSSMSMMGLCMCYLPALAVPVVFGFATSLVAIHRMSAFQGVKTAWSHFMAHLPWHATFGAIYVGLSMVAAYVPVLGPAFLLALHTRAYRKVFGDGETAVL